MLRKWSALRAWSVPSARYAEHLTSLCALGAILHVGDSLNFTAAQPQHHYWNICKLVEEIGEVAEVLNKRAGRKASDENDLQEQLGIELVDMIHYIVAIAAINDIDLTTLMIEKDK